MVRMLIDKSYRLMFKYSRIGIGFYIINDFSMRYFVALREGGMR